jgi:hypothetical protein
MLCISVPLSSTFHCRGGPVKQIEFEKPAVCSLQFDSSLAGNAEAGSCVTWTVM